MTARRESIPKLTVICITYNHAAFIRDALDGFVMQKTNFPFEVIVHDDASTDGTADIIREYATRYPDIIIPILQTENQHKLGTQTGKTFIWPRVRGEYVALCEGDDYWTDPNKLQRQVDFLDANPDYSICFHPVTVIWADNREKPCTYPSPEHRFNKTTLGIQDLLIHNFIPTNSVVYRWRMTREPDLFPRNITPGDWFLHLLHAQTGKIKYLDEVMSVYRRHSDGMWTGAWETDDWFIRCGIRHLNFYRAVAQHFKCDNTVREQTALRRIAEVFAQINRWDLIAELATTYPDLYTVLIDTHERRHIEQRMKTYKHIANRLIVITGLLAVATIILGTLMILQ